MVPRGPAAPVDRPAFASIAAVICVGITYGKRRWRALELVGGVVLGISISTVLLYLIGTGPIQIALLVILAMTAALLFRGGELLVNEAAISAILLASLQTTDAEFSADRILEGPDRRRVGLLIASLLLPPDPVATASRVAETVIGSSGARSRRTPRRWAAATSRRRAGARGRARASTTTSTRSRRCCRSPATRRVSPDQARRPRRAAALRAHDAAAGFAVRNTRAPARLLLRDARTDEAAPEARRRRCTSSPRRCGARRAGRGAAAADAPARARAERGAACDDDHQARALAAEHVDRRAGARDRRRPRPRRRSARRVRRPGREPADRGAARPGYLGSTDRAESTPNGGDSLIGREPKRPATSMPWPWMVDDLR